MIAEFTRKPAPTCTARFGETDWIAPAWEIVVVTSDGAASQTISLANTGGNPSGPTFGGLENPSFRKMLHTMDLPAGTSGTTNITVAQFPQGGTYNPTSLVVQFIYREDQIIISNPDALPVTWGMAVRQSGVVRLAPLGTFYTPSWQRKEVDVTPADFGRDPTSPVVRRGLLPLHHHRRESGGRLHRGARHRQLADRDLPVGDASKAGHTVRAAGLPSYSACRTDSACNSTADCTRASGGTRGTSARGTAADSTDARRSTCRHSPTRGTGSSRRC